jgi:hypothetical protein
MAVFVIGIHFLMSMSAMNARAVQLLITSLVISTVGGLLQTDFLGINSQTASHFGFLIQFMSTEMQEVAITTLIAKLAPATLYQSRFSPNFVLTFLGTFARGIGCASISIVGALYGCDPLRVVVNLILAPLVLAYGFLLIVLVIFYQHINA